MRSHLLIFEGHEIAIRYTTDDRPWLDAPTLCNLLGYADWRRALLEHCHPADILFGDDEIPQAFISLDALQRLSTQAASPQALRVHQWLGRLQRP
ncbi:BRO family, N-terminal domain [Pseudomonas flavescens]|uniref:BRO family, N-terminal domain n=1 Tax=Phytopseudomonas flavescens TaxID=29435 RepID=A0A1G8PX93_9GAMM|nr:BRO family protein [Pseudomonas flavescens]SDI96845.1 BRO family, N-terminal domain [Pseudomonas flavescens]